MKNNKRKVVAMSLLVLLMIGSIYQYMMRRYEDETIQPVGKIYTVNSHDMHMYTAGEGEKSVIFVAGSGTPCAFTDFYYMQKDLGEYCKTVSYDHAGYGWSEETNIPRTVDVLVKELHELLEKGNITPPYILVGHSLGVIETIRFAQIYKEEVIGVVLLDGGTPEYYAEYEEVIPLGINRLTAGLRVTGINRVLGNIGIVLPFAGEDIRYSDLPDNIKNINKAMYYNKVGSKSNIDVLKNINRNAKTVLKNGRLKDIPMYILSSENGDEWEKVQKQMSTWSNMSQQQNIANANHYIHWSNRKEVIMAIQKMLK